MALILKEPRCIPTCVTTIVRGEIEAKCSGMIGSINVYSKTTDLFRCVCPCHNEDSEVLNEEQEQWLNERMAAPMGCPFKSCSEVVIGVECTDRS